MTQAPIQRTDGGRRLARLTVEKKAMATVQVVSPDDGVLFIVDDQIVVKISVAGLLPPPVDDAAPGH